MKIAALSDIHGNLPALEAVLAEAGRERVDLIVNLGDIASGPLWPAQTCARLLALAQPTIRGNHERQLGGDPATMSRSDAQTLPLLAPQQLQWLLGLPRTLALLGGELLCVHGTPTSDVQYLLETVTPDYAANAAPGVRLATAGEIEGRLGRIEARIVLCGHSHLPRIVALGGVLIVNPGSVGLQAYDDDHPHVHIVETGSPLARWAIVEKSGAGWQAQLRATAYDHEAAARQAEAQRRGDWADALRSGRVGRFEAALAAGHGA